MASMADSDATHKWEARYTEEGYEPDRDPTPFVVDITGSLSPGQALCLAAGAGRNAVYLATRGWSVTATDISPSGLAWCRRQAQERGVEVHTVVADLTTWDAGSACWDLVTMVCYLQPDMFPRLCRMLRPGGHFLLHTFSCRQLGQGWGPKSATHLAEPDAIRAAFQDWHLVHFDDGLFVRPDGRTEGVVRMLAVCPG
ncbi:MAG: class I SAM-dependent methyltransferase [bacterium]|nr:class I SAM-dependent methyltransferase [bacterium]